ncbi:unnamed protein product [Sphacelaria rigidula]
MDIIDKMENATIRVDTATQQGSVLDVLRMVLGCDSTSAKTAFRRLKEDSAELGAELGAACTQLRINGKGKLTPVADAKTLVEIVFNLPGKIARDFRRKGAAKVCRLLGGDTTLVTEIEKRRAELQSTAEGRATQNFLLANSEKDSFNHIDNHDTPMEVEAYNDMPAGFRFLDNDDRRVVAKKVVELTLEERRQDIKRQRCNDMVKATRP